MPQTKLTGETVSEIEVYLRAHPEIEFIKLVWTWNYLAQYEEDRYIWEEVGTTLDAEYTFCGNRREAFKFLAEYDCWNFLDREDLKGAHKDNCLSYVHVADSEASGNYFLTDRPNSESVYMCEREILRSIDQAETYDEQWFTTKVNH